MRILIIIPILALLAIFITSKAIGRIKTYQEVYWSFQFFHLLGGIFVAMFWSNFLYSWTSILFATLIVSILWEAHERIVEKNKWLRNTLLKFKIAPGPITTTDTVFDLTLDILGGIIFLILNYYFWS